MRAATPYFFSLRWRWIQSPAPLLLVAALLAWAGRWVLSPSGGLDSGTSITPKSSCPVPRALTESGESRKPVWPESRLEGAPAKHRLLALLDDVKARIDRIPSYTATLFKQERIGGVLGPKETMEMKVRHRPFAVYLKYRGHKDGQEVIYAEGRNENQLVAHAGDWTSRLIPRLTLDPTGFLAMADNRHPITEAGLAHLIGKLSAACRLDLDDPGASTVLDRFHESGRLWLRSVHDYTRRHPERPFCRVEVCYDADTGLPLRFLGYEWTEPDQADGPQLGESYRYDNLRLDAGLADLDFETGNPAYAFTR